MTPDDSVVGSYPIPDVTTPPADWNPEGVMYYNISARMSEKKQLEFYLSQMYDDAGVKDVEAYARTIALTGHPPASTTMRDASERLLKGEMFQSGSPLDVAVDRQCYLIFQLDKTINWSFTQDGPAMTMKHDYGGSVDVKNMNLLKVTPEGKIVPGDDPSPSNVLYMSCVRRRAGEVEGYNLFIYFQTGNKQLPLVIDPDIKNDGGLPYPPGPG